MSNATFDNLNNNVVRKITSNLESKNTASIARTSKRLYNMTKHTLRDKNASLPKLLKLLYEKLLGLVESHKRFVVTHPDPAHLYQLGNLRFSLKYGLQNVLHVDIESQGNMDASFKLRLSYRDKHDKSLVYTSQLALQNKPLNASFTLIKFPLKEYLTLFCNSIKQHVATHDELLDALSNIQVTEKEVFQPNVLSIRFHDVNERLDDLKKMLKNSSV